MIKVAVIGCGGISTAHIEGLLEQKGRCEIVALCDIYPNKAEDRKKQYNLSQALVVDSHKKLIGSGNIDLICVCTPPYTHAEISIDFLNDKINVLCEKPMAPSLKDCDAMIEAAEKNGKTLSVIAQNRFRNAIMNLKQVLDTKKAGRILHAQIDSFWWRGHSYYDLWWRGTWEKEGGGCTLNHAVHHIDMMNWMMGTPKAITAVLSNANHDNSEVEDLSVAVFQFDKGSVGQITSSLVNHGEEQQIVLQGEYARISAPWKVHASISKENGFPSVERNESLEKELTSYIQNLPDLKFEGHAGQIENVLTALEQNTAPLLTGVDGRNTIEVITVIYKSGFSGSRVSLPLKKDDPFYTAEGIMKNVRKFYEKTTSVENFSDTEITVGSSAPKK